MRPQRRAMVSVTNAGGGYRKPRAHYRRVLGCLAELPAFEPARPGDAACEAACAELIEDMEDVYLADLAGDWVGVQYYTRQRVDPARADGFAPAPAGAPLTQMGWEHGLRRIVRPSARAFGELACTDALTALGVQKAGKGRPQ